MRKVLDMNILNQHLEGLKERWIKGWEKIPKSKDIWLMDDGYLALHQDEDMIWTNLFSFDGEMLQSLHRFNSRLEAVATLDKDYTRIA